MAVGAGGRRCAVAVEWQGSLDAALQRAREERKSVLVDLYKAPG